MLNRHTRWPSMTGAALLSLVVLTGCETRLDDYEIACKEAGGQVETERDKKTRTKTKTDSKTGKKTQVQETYYETDYECKDAGGAEVLDDLEDWNG